MENTFKWMMKMMKGLEVISYGGGSVQSRKQNIMKDYTINVRLGFCITLECIIWIYE